MDTPCEGHLSFLGISTVLKLLICSTPPISSKTPGLLRSFILSVSKSSIKIIPLYEKAKRIGIIKVKDELLTCPEIKSMMKAEKKEFATHSVKGRAL